MRAYAQSSLTCSACDARHLGASAASARTNCEHAKSPFALAAASQVKSAGRLAYASARFASGTQSRGPGLLSAPRDGVFLNEPFAVSEDFVHRNPRTHACDCAHPITTS